MTEKRASTSYLSPFFILSKSMPKFNAKSLTDLFASIIDLSNIVFESLICAKPIAHIGNVFKNKKVLITGNTGFKGSWLSIWLDLLGAKIYGLALEPPTNPSLFKEAKLSNIIQNNILDIRDSKNDELKKKLRQSKNKIDTLKVAFEIIGN